MVEARMERQGNAPFIGRSQLRVLSEAGELLFEEEQNVALYFELFRRYLVPLEDLPLGDYKVEMTFESERQDIPQGQLIPIEPVRAEASFTVTREKASLPPEAPVTEAAAGRLSPPEGALPLLLAANAFGLIDQFQERLRLTPFPGRVTPSSQEPETLPDWAPGRRLLLPNSR